MRNKLIYFNNPKTFCKFYSMNLIIISLLIGQKLIASEPFNEIFYSISVRKSMPAITNEFGKSCQNAIEAALEESQLKANQICSDKNTKLIHAVMDPDFDLKWLSSSAGGRRALFCDLIVRSDFKCL